MPRKQKPKRNRLVIGDDPVTGHHYLKVLEKLNMGVGPFLNRLGANMKDHYLINQDLDALIPDEGMALHLRLLDHFPELIRPEPTVDDLVQEIKWVARENPDLKLPMRITPSLVGLMLGRHIRTPSLWNTKKSEPSWKILELMRDFMTLLETQDDPAAFLERYVEIVRLEAVTRGVKDIFADKKWPRIRKPNAPAEPED